MGISAGIKEFQVSTATHASPPSMIVVMRTLIVVMRKMGSWWCLSVTKRLLVFVALRNGKKYRRQGIPWHRIFWVLHFFRNALVVFCWPQGMGRFAGVKDFHWNSFTAAKYPRWWTEFPPACEKCLEKVVCLRTWVGSCAGIILLWFTNKLFLLYVCRWWFRTMSTLLRWNLLWKKCVNHDYDIFPAPAPILPDPDWSI